MDFCLLLKTSVKIKVKTKAVNTAKNFIMLNNLQQMHLKILQKRLFKKEQKQLVISLIIKLLIELRKSQEFQRRMSG